MEERPHPIKEQVEYLLSKGIGVDDVGWKEASEHQKHCPCVESPLMQAVCFRDYWMVKFLLEAGADPEIRLFTEEWEWYGYEKWLYDDLDLAIYNGAIGEARQNALEILALLLHYGSNQWPGDMCITVDKEKRTIRIQGPDLLF